MFTLAHTLAQRAYIRAEEIRMANLFNNAFEPGHMIPVDPPIGQLCGKTHYVADSKRGEVVRNNMEEYERNCREERLKRIEG